MIRAYRRKDWETAHRELESCRSQAPEIVQFVYELYEQRIADLQATPPPPDWDGVYVPSAGRPGPAARPTARCAWGPRPRPARARALPRRSGPGRAPTP